MASGSSSRPLSNTGKLIGNEIVTTSMSLCDLANEEAGNNSAAFPTTSAGFTPVSGRGHDNTATGDEVVEMKNAVEFYFLEKGDPKKDKGEDVAKWDMAHNYSTCEKPVARVSDVNDESRALQMEIVLASEFRSMKEREAYGIKIQDAASSGKGNEESPSIGEKDTKAKMVMDHPVTFPIYNLESTAENVVETSFGENVCGVKKGSASGTASRARNNAEQDDELLLIETTLVFNQSPTTSRFQVNQRKKSKTLSDGEENERLLNEDNGSQESVESRNSAGLVSKGKRRWNLDQQLIIGSKRVKRQTQDSPGSSSLAKPDSSFVNWISTMMKGFLKSSEDKAPFLSSALTNPPNHGHENPDQDTLTCNRKEDPASKSIGFQSIFQSLYCQKTKGEEAVTFNADHQTEGSEECEQDNKICDLNATPIACRMVTANIFKQFPPSNEKLNETTSSSQADMAVLLRDTSMSFPAIQENNRSISTENQYSCKLVAGKEKDGKNNNSSQGEHKTNDVGKIGTEQPSEENTGHDLGYKSTVVGSSWIGRFAPKSSGPSLSQYPFRRTGEVLKSSADSMGLISQLHNPYGCSGKDGNAEVRKQSTKETLPVQNYGTANGSSFGYSNLRGHHNDNSLHKVDSISPAERVKTSGAMASVFARRLDALKHITPSDDPDHASISSMTCFVGGVKGHDLRECLRVTDTNLDVRNENDVKAKNIIVTAPTLCYENSSEMEKDLNNRKVNEAVPSERKKLNVMLFEKEIEIASHSREKGLKIDQIMPFHGFVNGLISDIPMGIIDAVRSLRLTRTNILKWMNSSVSLSPLDGYFVRLRLGKWEEGLGGTGYYVARITGAQIESPSNKSKKSIAVNVGGIKFVVESQYVSNHDFLEDELRAWWSAAWRDGGKLPSEEELRLKVEEKNALGF